MDRMGFGQVDANNRVIPRWEQSHRQTQPPQAQAPSLSPYDMVLQVLQDPRNAWIGMSPLGMATRPMGWGAEVLRRYKLKGGTPQTLDKTLKMRGVEREGRDIIREGYRQGTDIAAPPPAAVLPASQGVVSGLRRQHYRMEDAGDAYDAYGQGLRTKQNPRHPYSNIADKSMWEEALKDDGLLTESGARGNAAYDAVSRSIRRMLDDERGSFSPFGWGKAESAGPNMGGFAPSVEQMRSASKDIIQNGRDMRQAYIDHIIGMNHYVDNFQANNPLQVQELMRLELNRPQLANDISATAMGKMDLQKEVGKAFDPAMESNPPTQVRRLFGLK